MKTSLPLSGQMARTRLTRRTTRRSAQLARQRQTKFEKIVADFGSNKELTSQKRSNRGREGRYGAEL
jgi:hypothetical protein